MPPNRHATYLILALGVVFNAWVAVSRFSLVRVEDVLILPFWLIWMVFPYAYPALVLRRCRQPLAAGASALALLALFTWAWGDGTQGQAGFATLNPFIPIAGVAVAMAAHWLACAVLRERFALPWKQDMADDGGDAQ